MSGYSKPNRRRPYKPISTVERPTLEPVSSVSIPARSRLEILQAYGGILALAITILYSWPLGVWDTFISTPQKRLDQQFQEAREALEATSDKFVQMATVPVSVSDPQLQIAARQALQNQVILALSRHEGSYRAFRERLYPEELMMVGIIYSSLSRHAEAVEFYVYVTEKLNASPAMKIDAYRSIGAAHYMLSRIQSLKLGRENFANAVLISRTSGDPALGVFEAQVLADWALMERNYGDWLCAEEKIAEAYDVMSEYSIRVPVVVQYVNLASQQLAMVGSLPGQSSQGCID